MNTRPLFFLPQKATISKLCNFQPCCHAVSPNKHPFQTASKTDVLLIIDELGKNLEFAAHNPGSDDLYLLQQLAELPRKSNQVYIIGLLHQTFAEYSQRLASVEKNEWAKIQGRFEDIPFTESTEQMTLETRFWLTTLGISR